MRYKILYLPTGEYIKGAFSFSSLSLQEKPYILDTKAQAEHLINSMIRHEKPTEYGFMGYNNIMFPSNAKHFVVIEHDNE